MYAKIIHKLCKQNNRTENLRNAEISEIQRRKFFVYSPTKSLGVQA